VAELKIVFAEVLATAADAVLVGERAKWLYHSNVPFCGRRKSALGVGGAVAKYLFWPRAHCSCQATTTHHQKSYISFGAYSEFR
jgi:hypothetical protein